MNGLASRARPSRPRARAVGAHPWTLVLAGVLIAACKGGANTDGGSAGQPAGGGSGGAGAPPVGDASGGIGGAGLGGGGSGAASGGTGGSVASDAGGDGGSVDAGGAGAAGADAAADADSGSADGGDSEASGDGGLTSDAATRDCGYGDSGTAQGTGGLCYPKPGGSSCPTSEFCDFEWTPGICGFAFPNPTPGPGTCMKRPGSCTSDCPGVCGCDGVTYCNACVANAAGVDIRAGSACADGGTP